MSGSGKYIEWRAMLDQLGPVAENLIAHWERPEPNPEERQDLERLTLSSLAGAWLSHVSRDVSQPTFAPLWNMWLNMGGPNPDYSYRVADIDPKGTYRLSGYRGTCRFVEIAQSAWEMMLPRTAGHPTGGDNSKPRPLPLPFHDFDSLSIADNGWFSVILSPERPEGYDGDWWQTDPRCIKLMMRSCSCDWVNEIDARVAIVRLDRNEPMSREELSRRMGNVAAWTEGIIAFDIRHAQHYRDSHPVNEMLVSQAMLAGGGVAEQLYYDCWFDLGEDEALIVDTAVPENARYWQILVADDRFSTVDWVYRQSSLNDTQMRIDSDGRARFVVSARDPGVHNWLDRADNRHGIVQMRLKSAPQVPDPMTKVVPVSEVRDHLPADTPSVSKDQRAEALRKRAEAAQMRIWW